MSEAKGKAKQDLSSALSIDDKLIEARTTLANLKFQYDWDFRGADADFKQVIALNPNFAEAHHQYAWYLTMMGKPMDGEREMILAQQLDPANPVINVDLCLPYYLGRRFDEAIVQGRKAVEMFPNFFLGHVALGEALFEKGEHSKGIEELEKGTTVDSSSNFSGGLAYCYAKAGRKDDARKLLAKLKQQSNERYVAAFWIAVTYVGLGEKDEAFAWLEKGYEDRSWFLVWIKMDPRLDSLRSDPRFTDLMRRIGFPE
jgi:tetratricopeptide (TPR) repeat protein